MRLKDFCGIIFIPGRCMNEKKRRDARIRKLEKEKEGERKRERTQKRGKIRK